MSSNNTQEVTRDVVCKDEKEVLTVQIKRSPEMDDPMYLLRVQQDAIRSRSIHAMFR